MTRLDLTLGCGDYDRTRALADGRVQVEGVDLRYVALEPEEVFFRMARHEEFDAADSRCPATSSRCAAAPRSSPFRFSRQSGSGTPASSSTPGRASGHLPT